MKKESIKCKKKGKFMICEKGNQSLKIPLKREISFDMVKCSRLNKKNKEAIKSSIAHLNGYALVMRRATGYRPVAVLDNIKELKSLLKKKGKC